MSPPMHRRAPAKPHPTQVATLAAKLEHDTLILHHLYVPGYGGLSGPQIAPGAPRPIQARLRLLAEKHLMDSLRIGGHGGVEVWLDYADDERPLDELYPRALVIARQAGETISVPLTWPSLALKTLKFGAAAPITQQPTTVMLGARDAGEVLVSVVTQIVAAAVLALNDDDKIATA